MNVTGTITTTNQSGKTTVQQLNGDRVDITYWFSLHLKHDHGALLQSYNSEVDTGVYMTSSNKIKNESTTYEIN